MTKVPDNRLVRTRVSQRRARVRAHSFAEVSAVERFEVDRPICWQPPLFDIPMEARMRPMAHLRHVPMLHRVPMDVIDMSVEVGLITDEMFPESMLPQGALVPFSAARIHPFGSIESGLATLRDHPLDDTPTVGEILISGR